MFRVYLAEVTSVFLRKPGLLCLFHRTTVPSSKDELARPESPPGEDTHSFPAGIADFDVVDGHVETGLRMDRFEVSRLWSRSCNYSCSFREERHRRTATNQSLSLPRDLRVVAIGPIVAPIVAILGPVDVDQAEGIPVRIRQFYEIVPLCRRLADGCPERQEPL